MTVSKADIISRLQKEIFSLQGFKPVLANSSLDAGLEFIKHVFPQNSFPIGAVHEFIYTNSEDAAATIGFVSGIMGSLMQHNGTSIWISNSRTIFPPALKSFGISPEKIIFIDLKKEKEVQWTIEEALKCEGLAVVIGEMTELSFKASRRLQLAVEQSNVTGFILRSNPRSLNTTACVTRWKISSLPSHLPGEMPGVGFPRWNVELQKVRNGKPGVWQMEFYAGRFRLIPKFTVSDQQFQRKAG